jgi:hypothetical protein
MAMPKSAYWVTTQHPGAQTRVVSALVLGAAALFSGLVAAAASSAPYGAAARIREFQTPSRNIACTTISDHGIRCDIRSGLRPRRGCEIGYWASIQMNGAQRARPHCVNDTMLGSPMPVLVYGRVFRNGIITCVVRLDGLRCRSVYGHGFFLSRQRYSVY